ncbi:sporulation protein YlmC with PRC-barrel domain [Haloarcula quadrata]|jgi:sporulation protein YlmC with PRC-barrel domain|uniref:Sporulation protein YlmC with PRC-barrel domain n=1 Tax=Haloarcula quadrata TaxID=182779 RepID=A0A495QMN0_9EURY|nr:MULTISPECIES: PRC-barrel domain-containing protein [Haloarcula]NHN65314.1 photosystem reaction center subunit H [Haloarcula sp. JP-Z28]RKS74179.1 sporulation protein YlmC with PRC-barrel domain [Haloarcula quadrata]
MQTVLASTLSNTRVMSTDGQELGTLHNVTFHTVGGNLNQLVIETDAKELFGKEQDGDGCVRLPADLIESLRDHLIIRPPDEYLE